MEVFILVNSETYEYLGVASTFGKAEKKKTELLEELPMMEAYNIAILQRVLEE